MIKKTMGYEVAINKAWNNLAELKSDKIISIRFLADEYSVDPTKKKVISLSCNTPAKDFITILLLHYLVQKIKGLPALTNEWADFRQFSGIEGYLSAFKKRVLEPIIRKYGNRPQGLLTILDRLPGKRISQGDIGLVLEAFEGVPVLITLWRSDEEFGPEANMLFDKSIKDIFCVEDIIVLAQIVANQL